MHLNCHRVLFVATCFVLWVIAIYILELMNTFRDCIGFCSNSTVYPLVIAAHPSEANQIALGMSDGAVHVVEPSDAEPKWGASPPDNGSLPSVPSNTALSSQASEPPSR